MVSEVALGCMRIVDLEPSQLDLLIKTAVDGGVNLFDHADIYGGGACEEVFAASVRRLGLRRDTHYLQSKCGISQGFYDFSKQWIISSAEGILKRLQTDYLDMLLLHRPDALMEPEEVSEAFTTLQTSGKVRNFGVSNFNAAQFQLLQASLQMKLQANQMQFGLAHSSMVDSGVAANTTNANAVDRDGGILDYCRLQKVTVQAWSPFVFGAFEGVFIDNPKYADLNAKMDEISAKYNLTKTGLAVAWILRHPAQIQAIVGTTKPERLKEISKASGIAISRQDWYELYRAAGNPLP